MDARKTRARGRPGTHRAALFGAGALILVAGAALPFGFSPDSLEPFQKAAQAKGGGSGAGGPPDHSNAGGNGGGHGNGHGNGNGGLTSSDYDEGEDGYEKDKLGKFNAANAAEAAFMNANANSTVRQLYIYRHRVDDESADNPITTLEEAIEYLKNFANKELNLEVVNALNELLGLEPF